MKNPLGDDFTRNVFTLTGGTVISQLIPLLLTPILTRIYSPGEFGLFALYFSITMIFSVFITMRYEMVVILPEDDHDAFHVMILSFIITLLISFASFLSVIFFRNGIAGLLKTPAIAPWLFFVPFSVLFIGMFQSLYYWSNRKGQYKRLAMQRVARGGASSLFSILFNYSALRQGGLIAGDTVGQGINSCSFFYQFFRDEKQRFLHIRKDNIFKMARRYSQFPKYNVVSGLLEKLAGNMPIFLLTPFFGVAVSGLFSISQRVISIPAVFVARSVGDVFRQKASEQYQAVGTCRDIYMKTLKNLTIISIIPFIVLFVAAPYAFGFVFGDQWIVAGKYCQYMTIMFFLQFIASPLSNMFLVAEKQKIDLMVQVFLVLGLSMALYTGYVIFNDPSITIILYAVVYSIKYIFELILSYRFSMGYEKRRSESSL